MKSYNKSIIPLAKNLRTNMTPEEKHLWYDFLRDYPIRFQRQKAIGNYIADFYCAKARLVTELDGSMHGTEENRQKDQERTSYLNSVGISVIRFSNDDIRKHFKEVCLEIDKRIFGSLPPSAAQTPQHKAHRKGASSDGGGEEPSLGC